MEWPYCDMYIGMTVYMLVLFCFHYSCFQAVDEGRVLMIQLSSFTEDALPLIPS